MFILFLNVKRFLLMFENLFTTAVLLKYLDKLGSVLNVLLLLRLLSDPTAKLLQFSTLISGQSD